MTLSRLSMAMLLGTSVFIGSGCAKKSKPPVGLRWDGTVGQFESAPGDVSFWPSLLVGLEKDDVVVRWGSAPAAAKLVVGGKEWTGAALAEVHLPVAATLGKIPAASAFDVTFKYDFGVELDFTVDGGVVHAKVPPLGVTSALREKFVAVRSGKALDLGAPTGGPMGVALLGEPTTRLFGAPTSLGDVRRVAFEEQLAPRASSKSCDGYTEAGKPDGKVSTLLLQPIDSVVSVFEVNTGARLDSKKFVAPDECPSLTVAVKGTYAQSYASVSEVEAWVRGFASK